MVHSHYDPTAPDRRAWNAGHPHAARAPVGGRCTSKHQHGLKERFPGVPATGDDGQPPAVGRITSICAPPAAMRNDFPCLSFLDA